MNITKNFKYSKTSFPSPKNSLSYRHLVDYSNLNIEDLHKLSHSLVNEFIIEADNQISFTEEVIPYFRKKKHPFKTSVDLRNLKGFEVLEPIKIQLGFENSELFAEIPELELYSYGNDEIECIKELKGDIINLFKKVNEDYPQEKLGANPRKWKEFLNFHLKKINEQK